MMIELVSQETNEHVELRKLPALISTARFSEQRLPEESPTDCRCLIHWADDHLVVWDLGGGVLVNGVRRSKASVAPGDTLKLGAVEFKVQPDEAPKRYVRGLRC